MIHKCYSLSQMLYDIKCNITHTQYTHPRAYTQVEGDD